MNSPRSTATRILTASIATALTSLLPLVNPAHAVDGIWTNLAGGSWPTTTNWSGGTVASGIDAIADFSTLNITANATVTLDGARTVGTLKFGDATTVSNDWILNTGTAGPLTLDVTTGQANINVVNRTATIGAVLAGTDGLAVAGAGTLILGAANTFTGGLTLSGATVVQLNNNTAASTNAITYGAASTGRLVVNGGVTIANTFNIGAGITGAVGRGLIEASDANGRATVTGPINITAGPTSGGIFRGGLTVGNELVIGGVITSSVPVTQRDGRVIYTGGGTGYTSLGVTNAAIVGANNGISTAATVQVALSGNGSLDLGAFNQSLSGLIFAASGIGTVTSGTGVLTLTGAVSSSGNFTHVFNGNVNLGGGTRNFTTSDGTNELDLVGAAAISNGTLNKLGTGTFAPTGAISAATIVNAGTLGGTATFSSTLAVNGGTVLAPASSLTTGTITAGTLSFGTGATTLRMKVGAGGDLINTTTLTQAGTTTFNLNQLGGALVNGNYNLITYTGTSPGLGGFALNPVGHSVSSLVDTGTSIALQVTGNDRVIWDGTNTANLQTGATGNLKRESNAASTDYIEADDLLFRDLPVSSTVNIPTNISPSRITFENTSAGTPYLVTGSGGFASVASLSVTGGGTVTLRNPNAYSGATSLSGNSTLELDHDATGNIVLLNSSGVSVGAGSTLKLTRDDGDINFSRNLSGAGTVLVDPHTAAGAAVRNFLFSGTNTGFTGLLKLSPSNVGAAGLGSFRTVNAAASAGVTAASLGSAVIDVDAGGQLWFTGATSNNVTITGTGYAEAGGGTPVSVAAATTAGVYLGAGAPAFTYGGTGAIRMEGGTLNGNVTVDGTAKIGAVNGTGIITGSISGTGPGDLLVIGGGTATHSIIATGAVSVPRILVNGGATTGNQTLQIGNNGTAGSISTPEIILYGSAAANGVLRVNRTDGLTFTNQNILGGAAVSADLARTFFLVNTTGAGVTLNNSTLDLSDGTNGGTLRVGDTAGSNGSVLNIAGTSTVDVGYFTLAEVASVGGTVNQSGTSAVTFLQTLRIGHFGTNTSNYNLVSGSINTPTAAPGTFPYTTGATEPNGGIYVGIDGTGNLTQSGGTITTNFLVLDNRGDTGFGANMPSGVDTFQQNGGTLILKNAQGLITRNPTTAVNFNGGTIQALGANPALDTNRITVQAGGLTLETNGANTFTLYGPLAGTGTTALRNTGAGNGQLNVVDGTATNTAAGGTMPGGFINSPINLAANTTLQSSRSVSTTWTGAISGAGTVLKTGGGSLTLAGSGAGFTGTVNVNAGRLDAPTDLAATTITVADGGALGGEPTIGTVIVGTAVRADVVFNPNTPGALTAGTLTLNAANILSFSEAPTVAGPWTAINYTNKTGAGSFGFLGSGSYRNLPIVTDTGSAITVNITGTQPLVWTGAGGATWNVNTTTNWTNSSPAPDVFFFGDTVTFDDSSAVGPVTVTSGVQPWKTSVTSNNTAYAFTSSGSGISGPGSLEKSGNSVLTLNGPNTYLGRTAISAGTIAISSAASLGSGDATNTLALSGGGRLSYTAATALDLGPNRQVIVGTGGGSISHNNATAATLTIPGKLTGSGTDNLSFHSAAAGAGTFVLTGDNSGYTGAISVDAQGTGITVLRFGNQISVPAAGSITLNYAAAGANASATTLDLANTALPSTIALKLTSQLVGANSLRSQVVGTGLMSIDGPITATGNAGAVVQFSPSAGQLTINGNITEAAPGSFGVAGTPATVFFRNTGNTVVNGTINLPNANVTRVDNTGITTISSTGNDWNLTEIRSSSTLRIGANNALDTGAAVLIGQNSDAGNSFFDLNGFNQEIAGLNYIAGNGANTRGVINNGATQSTLTINNAASFIYGNGGGTNPAGNITGNIAIVKNGAGSQTLGGATNTYTGNVTVNAGTLVAGGNAASTALGSPTAAGRTVTVNNAGTILSFATNNVFGNGVGNANLPATVLNAGTTLTSTRYNVLGDLTLNGATLTQASTDAGGFEGYQFRGNVTIGGGAASAIATTAGKANHLAANTTFNVANATGDAASDLVVSAPLRNQSDDFPISAGVFNNPGALTKTGNGTLELTATNIFTGGVTVNAGTLKVNANAALGAVAGAVAINNNAVLQASGAVITAARTITLGAGGGTIDTNGNDVNLMAGSTVTGTTLTKVGTGKLVLAGTQTYATLDTEAGRTDLASTLGTGTSSIIANAETNLSVDQTLASLTIGNGAVVTLGSPLPPAPAEGFAFAAASSAADFGAADLSSAPVQGVPEPGSAALLVGGILTVLGLRRRS